MSWIKSLHFLLETQSSIYVLYKLFGFILNNVCTPNSERTKKVDPALKYFH